MQNLHLRELLAKLFCAMYTIIPIPPGLPSIDNDANDTENLLLKIQISEDFA